MLQHFSWAVFPFYSIFEATNGRRYTNDKG